MAAPALLHGLAAELVSGNRNDIVRAVAVAAHRKFFVRFSDERAVDALFKGLLDTLVAFGAGCCNMGAVHG